jgi:hypothetical protein
VSVPVCRISRCSNLELVDGDWLTERKQRGDQIHFAITSKFMKSNKRPRDTLRNRTSACHTWVKAGNIISQRTTSTSQGISTSVGKSVKCRETSAVSFLSRCSYKACPIFSPSTTTIHRELPPHARTSTLPKSKSNIKRTVSAAV